MRVAVLQLTSSDEPERNAAELARLLDEAAKGGADLIATPEVTNCVSLDRAHQRDVLGRPESDPVLQVAQAAAREHKIWIALGSLALQPVEGARFVNRSFLIDPLGQITAEYDKMHMFDVDLEKGESYRESSGYAPGDTPVLAQTTIGTLGLTICYDLRFPGLYRALAQAGAQVLMVPAAFSVPTGKAHWEVLLRARAIENGCFVIAAAQTGTHPAKSGASRKTFGHSLVVSPWGKVLMDAGTEPGVFWVDLDLREVETCRDSIPSLRHGRTYSLN